MGSPFFVLKDCFTRAKQSLRKINEIINKQKSLFKLNPSLLLSDMNLNHPMADFYQV